MMTHAAPRLETAGQGPTANVRRQTHGLVPLAFQNQVILAAKYQIRYDTLIRQPTKIKLTHAQPMAHDYMYFILVNQTDSLALILSHGVIVPPPARLWSPSLNRHEGVVAQKVSEVELDCKGRD